MEGFRRAVATSRNPYDELPYRSLPIPWTAPERLALCSLLHGGPRAPVDAYRVLELGCGDGTNLLALAFYRPQAQFVGIDASASAIATAEQRRAELALHNLRFLLADVAELPAGLAGRFDFILMHGLFSWVPPAVAERALAACGELLEDDGLLYLNYNARPGWNIRGLVRDLLLAQTAHVPDLADRARAAQAVAGTVAASLATQDHPYSKLLEQECRFVLEGHVSYVAHEFLARDNHCLWQSEFLRKAGACGLRRVADADFNYPSRRVSDSFLQQVKSSALTAEPLEDTLDLLSYRQLHSPLLARQHQTPRAMTAEEFAALYVASQTEPTHGEDSDEWRLLHPSGFEVEIKDPVMYRALRELARRWPRGARMSELFDDCAQWQKDVLLLHRYGTIELRITEPPDPAPSERLNACERRWGGYATSPFHDFGS
jgi:SAM-dependent methyltransferase